MSVSFVAAAWIWDINDGKRMNIKKFFSIGCSFIILLGRLITIFIVNPVEISDMLNASIFQKTLLNGENFSPIWIVIRFGFGYIDAIMCFPVLLLAALAAIGNVVEEPKTIMNMPMRIIPWLMPAVFVILSNQYYLYHFLSLHFLQFLKYI